MGSQTVDRTKRSFYIILNRQNDLLFIYLSTKAEREATGGALQRGEGGGGGVGGRGACGPVQQEPSISERTLLNLLQSRVKFILSSENIHF